jgi:hypothetical protein
MSKGHIALVLAALGLPAAAAAQVGYPPEHSPYRPILLRTSVSALGGYVAGSSGIVGVGPAGGYLGGLRYEMRLTGPTDGSLSVTWGKLKRMVPHPMADSAGQLTGPVRQSVLFVTGGLSILLAGDKTWNGLAPYLGGTIGVGFGGGLPADSSGFLFRAKLITGPHVGLRVYPHGSMVLRVEGQLLFWQLKYPSSFFTGPDGGTPILDPNSVGTSEWTAHPSLLIGLGFGLRL